MQIRRGRRVRVAAGAGPVLDRLERLRGRVAPVAAPEIPEGVPGPDATAHTEVQR